MYFTWTVVSINITTFSYDYHDTKTKKHLNLAIVIS